MRAAAPAPSGRPPLETFSKRLFLFPTRVHCSPTTAPLPTLFVPLPQGTIYEKVMDEVIMDMVQPVEDEVGRPAPYLQPAFTRGNCVQDGFPSLTFVLFSG